MAMDEEIKDPFIADSDDTEVDTTDTGDVAVDDSDDDDPMWDEE